MPHKNVVEILIRRYVYANEKHFTPTVKFKIGRCWDILACGYVAVGDKNALAKAVKEAKLHYPTPEEIEEIKLQETRKRERKINNLNNLNFLTKKTKVSAKSKKKSSPPNIQKIEELKEKLYGELSKSILPEVPKDKLFSD